MDFYYLSMLIVLRNLLVQLPALSHSQCFPYLSNKHSVLLSKTLFCKSITSPCYSEIPPAIMNIILPFPAIFSPLQEQEMQKTIMNYVHKHQKITGLTIN